jgi:hypothetical protein
MVIRPAIRLSAISRGHHPSDRRLAEFAQQNLARRLSTKWWCVADSFSSEWRDQVPDGQWYRQEDWWVVRERTTRPFGHLKVEANWVLLRDLNGLMSAFEWRDQVLYVRSIGGEGNVRLEDGFLVGRARFDFWASMMYPELLKAKIRYEIAAGIAHVAGTTGFGSKNFFIIHGHNESARTQLSTLLTGLGLKPIVLAEQSEGGMTAIEKFECHAPLSKRISDSGH